jgi:ubiquinone/menaquinone biosynthesis C-methylase UbiE
MSSTATPQATAVNPNKALWEKGDFTRIAETMRESGDALIESIGVQAGMDVLDLACGDGTTAIPSARRGANVLAVDIASNLVAAGNKRKQEEGFGNIEFREGDATNLQGINDQHFDLVVSIFGAMFAPKPFDVAREMVRVARKGGRIVMGNWIPGDPTLVAQILKIASSYTPPPPEGFVSPMLWGIDTHILKRFEQAGIPPENISMEKDAYTFKAAFPPTEFVRRFRYYYGPTMNAFEAAEKNGKADELQRELEDLFMQQNQAGDSATNITANFMRVTVRV